VQIQVSLSTNLNKRLSAAWKIEMLVGWMPIVSETAILEIVYSTITKYNAE